MESSVWLTPNVLSKVVCLRPPLAHLSSGPPPVLAPPGVSVHRVRGEGVGTVSESPAPTKPSPLQRIPELQEKVKPTSPNCSDQCGSHWRSEWWLQAHPWHSQRDSGLPALDHCQWGGPVLLPPAGLGDPLVMAFILAPHP